MPIDIDETIEGIKQELIQKFIRNAVDGTYYIGTGNVIKREMILKYTTTDTTFDRVVNGVMVAFDNAMRSSQFRTLIHEQLKFRNI